MKKLFLLPLLLIILTLQNLAGQSFKFAFISDTHIDSSSGIAEEDLQLTVDDINALENIDFVVLTGDITEMGTDEELKMAKSILSQLNIPFYIVPGNHDTGWSESGGVSFIQEFGYDKFAFEHNGYKVIGCASGPYVRMSDGHIPRDAVLWLDSVLAETPKNQRLIFANHYPLNNSLDNWYEVTDRLKKYNTQFAICGHGHGNRALDFEGIPATMGRSNLRAKEKIGGYNIVEVMQDSATFSERKPGKPTEAPWRKIALGKRSFDSTNIDERPTYTINDDYPQVKKAWTYHSDANINSTPLVINELVVVGNSIGKVEAISSETGEVQWSFQTEGAVFSSPAAHKDNIILGSGDGSIYCINSKTGEQVWKKTTEASVLGSPVIEKDIIYIGGSDGNFLAMNASDGKELWFFPNLGGPVVSKPLIYQDKVIFGAWDTNLYALNRNDGSLAWKWTNGSSNRMYSPAMCIPVAHDSVVYIVAPDRYISAIDAENGKTLWRSNEATVRESIGISQDKQLVYGKTMNDEIVAFTTNRNAPQMEWRMDCGFGYDHIPSMLIETEGAVYFGTKNGVIYSINPQTQQINWVHKVDNSMINTVNVISGNKLVAATMDGKVVLLRY